MPTPTEPTFANQRDVVNLELTGVNLSPQLTHVARFPRLPVGWLHFTQLTVASRRRRRRRFRRHRALGGQLLGMSLCHPLAKR